MIRDAAPTHLNYWQGFEKRSDVIIRIIYE